MYIPVSRLERSATPPLSAEDHVTPVSPPAFVFTTNDDDVVPSQNSMLYVAACQRAGVRLEFHMFEHGHHGVDLAEHLPALHLWTLLLESWTQQNQWMAPANSRTLKVRSGWSIRGRGAN